MTIGRGHRKCYVSGLAIVVSHFIVVIVNLVQLFIDDKHSLIDLVV